MDLVSRIRDLSWADVLRRGAEVVLIIVGAWVLYIVVGRVTRWAAERAEAGTEDPARRRRVGTVFLMVDTVIKGAVIFVAGISALRGLGIHPFISGSILGRAIATIVIAWVTYQLIRRALEAVGRTAEMRIEEEPHRQRVSTLLLLLRSIAKYAIIFFAGFIVLRDVGVDLTPILAGAGIVGLAVGFGAQNLVRDIVSGFFIIMENQYAVGDLVEINGVFGRVETVGLRTTRLRDPNGQLRYFPNGTISRANNYTEDYIAHVVNIPLPPEEPADPAPLVRGILEDFEREFRVFFEAPEFGKAEKLPTYSRVVRVRTRTIPGRQSVLEQKLPARVTAALERAGHPIPPGTEVTLSLRFPPPGENA